MSSAFLVFRLLVLLLAGSMCAVAAPQIAVVRISDVFNGYHATVAAREAMENERQAIQNDHRLTSLRSLATELKQLATRLSNAGLPEADREEAMRQYQLKQQEFQSLQEDFRSFQEAQAKEINARLVRDMQAILREIHQRVERMGDARGYDWVIDISGNSNTGVPFVLYNKDAPDLTEELLKELNGNRPAASGGDSVMPPAE